MSKAFKYEYNQQIKFLEVFMLCTMILIWLIKKLRTIQTISKSDVSNSEKV